MVFECNPVLDASMQHILTCLDHYNYREAIFTAERIFAENPSDEIVHLLATCFYRSNLPKQAKAFLLLQDSKSPKCKFLLAKCFIDTGCATEAENTLLGVGQDNTTPSDIAIFYKDTAPFVLLMLADIFKMSDRRKLAVACLKKCLDLDPLSWEAYKGLIDLRENVDPHEVFSLSTGLILNNHSCLRALSNKINIGDISHPNCPSKKRIDMHDSQEDLSVSRENVNPQFEENFNDPKSLPYSFNRTPVRSESDSSNANDRISTMSFNDCLSNVDASAQLRQKLCSPRHFRNEDYEKSKPMFGNIYSGPLSAMYSCVPQVFNMKVNETSENLQGHFPATNHSSLVLSHQHNSVHNSKKLRNTSKRFSYSSFRPTASTPLVPFRSDKIGVFAHSTTPITKNADHNTSLTSMSPLVIEANANTIDSGNKSTDNFCPVLESRMFSSMNASSHVDHMSSGPRTRSQAAKAAAAQKSGHSKHIQAASKEERAHCPSAVCDSDMRFDNASAAKLPFFESDNRLQSALNYLQLLVVMGKCYKALRLYRNADVLANISQLPKHQAETSLVYSWQASAFMELNNKSKACEILSISHKSEPWQMHGMVIYSTILWKSNSDTQLMSLSNEVAEMDRETPEYWCILGNSMSLKKENEIALRFFQRAVQVCPTYMYAYVLLGHEYFEQDDLEKALTSFRKALECDSNQYNAHYGIAMVYQRQEKYNEAETALREALKMNPDSCTLITNLAGIRMKLKQINSQEESLELLERACQANPKEPLCRYHKAVLLYHLGKFQESLNDCRLLESLISKEARIYHLMSLNYKQIGEHSKSMVYNTWATERDPKCTNDLFFDRSFVTSPVINMAADHMSTNSSSIMSSRNTSFSISARRNSESMQEDNNPSSDMHHNNPDSFTSD